MKSTTDNLLLLAIGFLAGVFAVLYTDKYRKEARSRIEGGFERDAQMLRADSQRLSDDMYKARKSLGLV